jgi:hypothetical protein
MCDWSTDEVLGLAATPVRNEEAELCYRWI